MLFRRLLHEDLGCVSYLVSDGSDAVVVDPKWEVEAYLELAVRHGLRIAHVLDATFWTAREARAEYPHEPLADGSSLEIGNVRIRALTTPGRRPDHLCFLIEDRS